MFQTMSNRVERELEKRISMFLFYFYFVFSSSSVLKFIIEMSDHCFKVMKEAPKLFLTHAYQHKISNGALIQNCTLLMLLLLLAGKYLHKRQAIYSKDWNGVK